MLAIENTLPVTSVVETAKLSERDKQEMFALYAAYYCGSNEAVFQSDLRNKTHVVLLRDQQRIQGFSTLLLYSETYEGKPLNVIYSGDTIVDKAYWGHPLLPKAWLQFAGSIANRSPETPLYWLLIVKGHRTYRYLQLFSREYYPRYDSDTPVETKKLMDYLASRRFGEAYRAEDGLVYFAEPRSFLSAGLAEIPLKDRNRPEVRFFLSKNPHYAQGDEMVCLCRLSPDNLTRVSLKWFMQGNPARK